MIKKGCTKVGYMTKKYLHPVEYMLYNQEEVAPNVGYVTKKYLHPIEFNFEHTQLLMILNSYI